MDRAAMLRNLLRICLIAAPILASVMSLTSDYNRHPDEIHHFEAAKYYVSHFLPPDIGDPEVRNSYSVWGVSYLNYHWIEYFLAGKFMLLVSPLVSNELLAARFWNIALLAGLALFFLWKSRTDDDVLLIASLLLITPQVWYVFSYVNNDAFPLAVSFILAYMVTQLRIERLRDVLIAGLLVGLLLISKTNYYSFLVFIALWLCYKFPPTDTARLRKLASIVLIAVSILTFRCALDFYVNGETNFVAASYLNYVAGNFEKQESRLMKYQEEVAEPAFKPSTIERDLAGTHPDMRLKDKGVSYFDLFTKMNWHRWTFESFVGVYGYMNIYAPKFYYLAIALLYAAIGGYVTLVSFKRREALIHLGILTFGAALAVFMSTYLSWSYAFQPQGRYLFPVLPMIGMCAYAARDVINKAVWIALVVACFLLSAYSFVFVGAKNINSAPAYNAPVQAAKTLSHVPHS
jgi:hypothetical protein